MIINFIKQNPLLAAGLAAAGGAMLRQVQSLASELVERQFMVTVRLESGNELYKMFTVWLDRHPNVKKMRTLCAEPIPGQEWAWDEELKGYASGFTPGPGLHLMKFKGRRIWLSKSIQRSEVRRTSFIVYELRTMGRSAMIFRELFAEAKALYLSLQAQGIAVRVAEVDGWDYRDSLVKRRPESVILPEGVMDELLRDLRSFYQDVNWYQSLNIPHRRGVLLYGPPGTGKTSTILAAASDLDCSIHWLPLAANWMDDSKLDSLMSEVSSRAILVLEDIDAIFTGRESDKKKGGGVTFSGLLNALDGALSPQGRVVFMTTNHVEKLDPALIRPGRIDIRLELGHPDSSQVQRLFDRFFPEDGRGALFADFVPQGTSMAALQEHLLLHRRDPGAALEEARSFWGEKMEDAAQREFAF